MKHFYSRVDPEAILCHVPDTWVQLDPRHDRLREGDEEPSPRELKVRKRRTKEAEEEEE